LRIREGESVEGLDQSRFLEEIRRAEEKFMGGYVGANYFVTRWASDGLGETAELRRRMLDVLVEEGKVEIYDAPDGNKAIRLASSTNEQEQGRNIDEEP
ncbi:MAG TPA: hypothetical protein PK140_25265, partial [Polyangiaceae bacterium]|nr:hypothetical protein [Polyangiaceae bacterium]